MVATHDMRLVEGIDAPRLHLAEGTLLGAREQVSDGETWQTTSLDDLGPDIARQGEIYGRRICRTMGARWGGDVIGPIGMLIVRNITTPWADPGYPHFWYSPDGTVWHWVDLPTTVQWAEGQPDPPRDARHWGSFRWRSPQATDNGFELEIETPDGDSWRITGAWESTDGLTWRRVESTE